MSWQDGFVQVLPPATRNTAKSKGVTIRTQEMKRGKIVVLTLHRRVLAEVFGGSSVGDRAHAYWSSKSREWLVLPDDEGFFTFVGVPKNADILTLKLPLPSDLEHEAGIRVAAVYTVERDPARVIISAPVSFHAARSQPSPRTHREIVAAAAAAVPPPRFR